jgi:hypothetical protein
MTILCRSNDFGAGQAWDKGSQPKADPPRAEIPVTRLEAWRVFGEVPTPSITIVQDRRTRLR